MQDIGVVLQEITDVAGTYHRLLLLVGRVPAETSQCIEAVAAHLDRPVLNLNAELSSALLEVPHRQRQLKAHKVVGDIIDGGPADIVLFDHTDILFSPSLRLDALALLKSLSRNKTVVATWSGTAKDGKLRHAEEWHPEYQSHAIEDIKVITVDQGERWAGRPMLGERLRHEVR
ncbi:BREX-3 system P-loop-containing protein BrxF [Magnetospirillum sp. UT-4]|uniref:BREX-3 system P-loop-containing protein BrxF n=1 Tax=Magnetospirillum sp. UT-4 TaxID=2681467 RepID=UPI00138365B5|nr:BREX-3 system P-loop-containing protein BrxF [Magnetospirillum sp. UT-4]CAA7615787.1 conserved hypothetical protein [Magnetospirillum sp. UT-4]